MVIDPAQDAAWSQLPPGHSQAEMTSSSAGSVLVVVLVLVGIPLGAFIIARDGDAIAVHWTDYLAGSAARQPKGSAVRCGRREPRRHVFGDCHRGVW